MDLRIMNTQRLKVNAQRKFHDSGKQKAGVGMLLSDQISFQLKLSAGVPCQSRGQDLALSLPLTRDSVPGISSQLSMWLSGKESPANVGDTGDVGLISGVGRSPQEEMATRLQYSCLENPKDRGACSVKSMGLDYNPQTILPSN